MGLFSLFKKKSSEKDKKSTPKFETLDSPDGPVWKPPLEYRSVKISEWPDDMEWVRKSVFAYLEEKVSIPGMDKYEIKKIGIELCERLCEREYTSTFPEVMRIYPEYQRHYVVSSEGNIREVRANCVKYMSIWLEYARDHFGLLDLNYYLMSWSNWYNGIMDDGKHYDRVPEEALKWSNGDIEQILGWCRQRVEKDLSENAFPTGLILLRHYLILREFWHEREPMENPMDFWERMWMRYRLDEMLIQYVYAVDWVNQNELTSGNHLISSELEKLLRMAGERGNPIALNQGQHFKWEYENIKEASRWKEMWQKCSECLSVEQASFGENWYAQEETRAAMIADCARKQLHDKSCYPLTSETFSLELTALYHCIEELSVKDKQHLVYYLRTVEPKTEIEYERLKDVWARLAKLFGDYAEKYSGYNLYFRYRDTQIGDFNRSYAARQFLKLDLNPTAKIGDHTVNDLLRKADQRDPETLSYLGNLYYNCESVHKNEKDRRAVGDVLLQTASILYQRMGEWCAYKRNVADKPLLKCYLLERNLRHNTQRAAEFARDKTYYKYPAFCAMLADRNYQREIKYSLDTDYVHCKQSMQAALDDGYPLKEVFDEMERQWSNDAALERWGREQDRRREEAKVARERAKQADVLRSKLDWAERDFNLLMGGSGLTVEEQGLVGQISALDAISHDILREEYISKRLDS